MSPKLPFEVSLKVLGPNYQAHKIQVKNPSLFKDQSLVGGEWVEARSGKRFDVVGKTSIATNSKQILSLLKIREVTKSGLQPQTTQPRM
jgi:hypothetical protein